VRTALIFEKEGTPSPGWLNRSLYDERNDPEFSEWINRLDAEIS